MKQRFDSISLMTDTSIFVRIDDVGKNDFPLLPKLISICRNARIPLILAVIPDQLSIDTANFIREELSTQQSGLIIAQHGVSHIPNSHQSSKMEFGLTEPVHSVISKLQHGRNILEQKLSTSINWYVPPWNKYGRNLVTALENLHYSAFSASKRLPFKSKIISNFPVNQDIVECYTPLTINQWPLEWLKKTSQLIQEEGVCGLMLHHHLMTMQDILNFEIWCSNITSEYL